MYKYTKQIAFSGLIIALSSVLVAKDVPCSVPTDAGQCVSDPSVPSCTVVADTVPTVCAQEGVRDSQRCSKEGEFTTISLYNLKYCGGTGTQTCHETVTACGLETKTKCKTEATGDTCTYSVGIWPFNIEKIYAYIKCTKTNVSGPNNYKPGQGTSASL